MRIDFSSVEDVDSFVSVPEGTYLCRITEVRERATREGDPRWSFRLMVDDGEYSGRTAAWDGFSWSERGMHRAKHVLSKLGFDTDGVLEVVRDDLVGRKAYVQVQFEEREDPVTGNRQVRPRVPYMGYQSADDQAMPWDSAGSANGA